MSDEKKPDVITALNALASIMFCLAALIILVPILIFLIML